MHCANENQLVKMVWVEGSKSKAARKCRQVKCILLTSLFIDESCNWTRYSDDIIWNKIIRRIPRWGRQKSIALEAARP